MASYDLTSGKTGRTYKVEFDNDPTPEDVDFAIDYFDSQPVAEEQPGYLSQLGTALSTGTQTALASGRTAFNVLTGDTEDTATALADLAAAQREAQAAQTPEDVAFLTDLQQQAAEMEAAEGILPTLREAVDLPLAALRQPGAALKTAVQSLPNVLVSTPVTIGAGLAGAAAGGLAGLPTTGPGALVTGALGAAAGGALANTALEVGPAVFDILNERTDGAAANWTREQILEALKADPTIVEEGLKRGATRGAVIGATEAIGLGAGSRLAGASGRAVQQATRRALVEQGVDLADDVAVRAGLQLPAVQAAREAAQAGFSRAGEIARVAGGAGIETAASGVGEVAAQAAAGQEINIADAFLEMLGEGVAAVPSVLAGAAAEANAARLQKAAENTSVAAEALGDMFPDLDELEAQVGREAADAVAQAVVDAGAPAVPALGAAGRQPSQIPPPPLPIFTDATSADDIQREIDQRIALAQTTDFGLSGDAQLQADLDLLQNELAARTNAPTQAAPAAATVALPQPPAVQPSGGTNAGALMSAAQGGLERAFRNRMRDRIAKGETVIFTRPDSIEAARNNPFYITQDLPDGTVQVTGVRPEPDEGISTTEPLPAGEAQAPTPEASAAQTQATQDEIQIAEAGSLPPVESQPLVQASAVEAPEGAALGGREGQEGQVDLPQELVEWDRDNRNTRGDEWFTGGHMVNREFEAAAAEGADRLQAHGMAKEATLSGGLRNLLNLLRNGVDPRRGGGQLYTAQLAKRKGQVGVQGATASGTAYRDGPFVLVQNREASQAGLGIRNVNEIAAVLVNEANVGQLDAIRSAIQSVNPNIIVAPYSEVSAVTRQILNQPVQPMEVAPAVSELPAPQAEVVSPEGGIRTAQAEFLQERGIADTETLTARQRKALEKQYQEWLTQRGGAFRITLSVQQGGGNLFVADWQQAYPRLPLDSKIDLLRAVVNNRGRKATEQDVAEASRLAQDLIAQRPADELLPNESNLLSDIARAQEAITRSQPLPPTGGVPTESLPAGQPTSGDVGTSRTAQRRGGKRQKAAPKTVAEAQAREAEFQASQEFLSDLRAERELVQRQEQRAAFIQQNAANPTESVFLRDMILGGWDKALDDVASGRVEAARADDLAQAALDAGQIDATTRNRFRNPATLPALRAVATNTATQEQVASLEAQGLARTVQGQPVITDAGLAQMPEAERPRLSEAERVAEIEGQGGIMASLRDMDAEYLGAVERGDMETAQRLVDEAAQAAGYNVGPVYHHGGFDVRENAVPETSRGFHLGTLRAAEERASGKPIDDFIAEAEIVFDDDLGAWFWSSQGTDSFDAVSEEGFRSEEAARRSLEEFATQQDFSESSLEDLGTLTSAYIRSNNPLVVADQKADWDATIERARKNGYDSVQYQNEFEDKGSTSYIAILPGQIKSADPVTYDDNGNVIPLSQRFQTESPDIRFSIRNTPPANVQPSIRPLQGDQQRNETLARRKRPRPSSPTVLRARDGQPLPNIRVTADNAAKARDKESRQVPGASETWIGTTEQFLAEFADTDAGRAVEGNAAIEAFYDSATDRAVVLTDRVQVLEGDARRAVRNGTSAAEEAVRRLIRHESFVHRGWRALPSDLRTQFLALADSVPSAEDLDTLAKTYRRYANWRDDPSVKALAFEEWLAQRIERIEKLPAAADGPLAQVKEWLGRVWQWLTGDDSLEATPTELAQVMRMMVRALETGEKEVVAAEPIRPSYIGEKAEMSQFMRDSLETARSMAAAGKSSEEIRAVTGWFPGLYDGKMRWELPDNEASFVDADTFKNAAVSTYGGQVFNRLPIQTIVDRIKSGNFVRLSDVFSHPGLFAAYPDAANIPFFPIGGNIVQGSHRIVDGNSVITATVLLDESGQISEESTSVLLHELQHYIQNREGFAKGASPDSLLTRADLQDAVKFRDAYKGIQKYRKQIADLVDAMAREKAKTGFLGFGGPSQKAIKSVEDRIKAIQDSVNAVWEAQGKALSLDRDSTRAALLSAINRVEDELGASWVLQNRNEGLNRIYKRVAGEIEARDVQARRTMTPEQRRATAPYSSENIAPEDAVVIFDGREQGLMASLTQDPNADTLRRIVSEASEGPEATSQAQPFAPGVTPDMPLQQLADGRMAEANLKYGTRSTQLQKAKAKEMLDAMGPIGEWGPKLLSPEWRASNGLDLSSALGQYVLIEGLKRAQGRMNDATTEGIAAKRSAAIIAGLQSGTGTNQGQGFNARMNIQRDPEYAPMFVVQGAMELTNKTAATVVDPQTNVPAATDAVRQGDEQARQQATDDLAEELRLRDLIYDMGIAAQDEAVAADIRAINDDVFRIGTIERLLAEMDAGAVAPSLVGLSRAAAEQEFRGLTREQLIAERDRLREQVRQRVEAVKQAMDAKPKAKGRKGSDPASQAKALIDKLEASPQVPKKPKPNPVRDLYREHLKEPMAAEDFIGALTAMGVDIADAQKLYDLAAIKIVALETAKANRPSQKEKLSEAERFAERVINDAAEQFADPALPVEEKQRKTLPIRDLFNFHVQNGMTLEAFIPAAAQAGLDEATARRLHGAGLLVREARQSVKTARAEARLDEMAVSEAGRLIYETSKLHRQSGYVNTPSQAADTIRSVFMEQVKAPVAFEQFAERLKALRVDEDLAARLFNVANRETAARQAMAEERQRQANIRREIKLDEMAAKEAGRLIYETSKLHRQSGYINATSPEADTIRKAFMDQVKKPVPFEQFAERLKALRVEEDLATRLFNVADREHAARKAVALERERQAEFKRLSDRADRLLDPEKNALASALNAIRSKTEGAPTWQQLFNQPFETQRQWRQRFYEALRADPALANLTPQETRDLAAALDKVWNDKRERNLQSILKRANLPGTKEKTKQKIAESVPLLLRYLNTGVFNDDSFRAAVAKKFGAKVLTADDLAKISDLAQRAQKDGISTPERTKLLDEMIRTIQLGAGVELGEVISNVWVTSVLSGFRTQFDMALSSLNGLRGMAQTAADVAIRKRNFKMVGEAAKAYFKTMANTILESANYFVTGDPTLLDGYQYTATQFMNEGLLAANPFDFFEQVIKDPRVGPWGKITAYFFAGIQRAMRIWDHVNSTSVKEGMIPLAMALDPERYKDARMPSKEDITMAKEKAIAIVGGNKTWPQKRDVTSYTRQILNDLLNSRYPGLLDEARETGFTLAYQNDPTGLGGIVYHTLLGVTKKMVNAAGKFRDEGVAKREQSEWNEAAKVTDKAMRGLLYIGATNARNMFGFRFVRFVGNRVNELISFTPLVGLARLAEKDMSATKRSMIYTNQVVGSMFGLWVISSMLRAMEDEEDPEKRGFDVEGSWSNLTPTQKNQRRGEGKIPYSIKIGDTNFNYNAWPMASLIATVGNLYDMKRYRPDKWNEKDVFDRLISAAWSGATSFTDISSLSGLMDLLGRSAYSTDPVEGAKQWAAKFSANYVGGFIPRALKDLDMVFDPEARKPDNLFGYFAKEIPFYRRTEAAGEKLYDIFGEPVQMRREPWSRSFSQDKLEPEYNLLGDLNERGIFLSPANPDNRTVGSGANRRELTKAEAEAYVMETGKLYKDYVLQQGERLKELDFETAKEKVSRDTERLRNAALRRAISITAQ